MRDPAALSRLLKKAHLRRWHAGALVAAYRKYASLGPARAALHLDFFEQPDKHGFFSILLDEGAGAETACASLVQDSTR